MDSKSVRPSVALVLTAKQFFAKFGTGVRYKKVFDQGRVFTKIGTVTSFRPSMSFPENRQWQVFRPSVSFHENWQWQFFDQALIFMKIGKWQEVFVQAWVFMKIGSGKRFSSKREFSWKLAVANVFRPSVSFHENRRWQKFFDQAWVFVKTGTVTITLCSRA